MKIDYDCVEAKGYCMCIKAFQLKMYYNYAKYTLLGAVAKNATTCPLAGIKPVVRAVATGGCNTPPP
jgi:hypothetical protein